MPRAGCTSQSRASAQARGARDTGASAPLQTGRGVAVGNHSSGPFGGSHPRPAFCAPTGAHPGEAIAWCLGTGAWISEVGRLRPPWGATLSPGGGTHREPLPYLVKSVAEGAGLAGVDPGPKAAPGQDQQPGTPAASGPHGGKGPASNARVLWAWGPSSTELGRLEPGPRGDASSPPDPRTRP